MYNFVDSKDGKISDETEREKRVREAKLGSLRDSQRASASESHGEYRKGQMTSGSVGDSESGDQGDA